METEITTYAELSAAIADLPSEAELKNRVTSPDHCGCLTPCGCGMRYSDPLGVTLPDGRVVYGTISLGSLDQFEGDDPLSEWGDDVQAAWDAAPLEITTD